MKTYKIIETWISGYKIELPGTYTEKQIFTALDYLKNTRGHYANHRAVEI